MGDDWWLCDLLLGKYKSSKKVAYEGRELPKTNASSIKILSDIKSNVPSPKNYSFQTQHWHAKGQNYENK